MTHTASHARVLSLQVQPQLPLLAQWRRLEQHAEWIELRLDAWLQATRVTPAECERWLAELLRQRTRPCLVTIHDPSAMGAFVGSDRERVEYLQAALRAGADAIDVPLHLIDALDPAAFGARCVVSWHGPAASAQALSERWAEMRAVAGPEAWIKLVPQAECAEDGLALLEALRSAEGPVIGFASGICGRFTRLLAPLYGSRWSYCALPKELGGDGTAPGQYASDEIEAWWPARGLDAGTLVFGVVGQPARHSASPRLFTECLRECGANAVYVDWEPREWPQFWAALERAGLPWAGMSITAPFKQVAYAQAGQHSAAAQATQAVNTYLRLAPHLQGPYGHNSDVAGARALLDRALSQPSRVVVVGAGGAARAAILAAQAAGHSVWCCARRDEAAQHLAAELGVQALARSELSTLAYDALVHTTPAGSLAQPQACAVEAHEIRRGAWILDAVYRPRETPLKRLALAGGARYADGVKWFVAQAQAQWELWSAAGSALEAQAVSLPTPQRLRALLERALQAHEQQQALRGSHSSAPRALCLIGLRAAGKSTLAPVLARRLGWPWVDLDRELERLYAKEHWPQAALECGAILERLGEPAFRALETRVLHEVLARPLPLVIASGGGVVEAEENRRALAQRARCVWLDADPKVLVERMADDSRQRPSLLGLPPLEELELLAQRRRPWYRELAELRVDASWPSEQAGAAVVEVLGLSGAGA